MKQKEEDKTLDMFGCINNNLESISIKLAELKNTLGKCASGLSLEEYDILHADIEELQILVYKVIEGNFRINDSLKADGKMKITIPHRIRMDNGLTNGPSLDKSIFLGIFRVMTKPQVKANPSPIQVTPR